MAEELTPDQPDARTHRMENASVYCRYCGAHPDNWQREQCEHREPDTRRDGSKECCADVHVHGCHADDGMCYEPAEHREQAVDRASIESRANEAIRLLRETNPQGVASKPHICLWSDQLSHSTRDVLSLLAQVERLEAENRAYASTSREQAFRQAEVAEARAVQAERERDALREGRVARPDGWVHCDYGADDNPGTPTCADALWNLRQQKEAAEARAQRYREALTTCAEEGSVVARRALSADPLVCRDPNLCWGTGTCPRDPACNE